MTTSRAKRFGALLIAGLTAVTLAGAKERFYTNKEVSELCSAGKITLDNIVSHPDGRFTLTGVDLKKSKKKSEKKKPAKEAYSVENSTQPAKLSLEGDAGAYLSLIQEDYSNGSRFIGQGLNLNANGIGEYKKFMGKAELDIQKCAGNMTYQGAGIAGLDSLNTKIDASALYNILNKGNKKVYLGLALENNSRNSVVDIKGFGLSANHSENYNGFGLDLCAKASDYYLNANVMPLNGENSTKVSNGEDDQNNVSGTSYFVEFGMKNMKKKGMPDLEGKISLSGKTLGDNKENSIGLKFYAGDKNRFSFGYGKTNIKNQNLNQTSTNVYLGYNRRFGGK